jgi:translation initiation factor 1
VTITALAQQIKKLCGSGGTVKDGNIEIQGDHCDKVMTKLITLGYKVKRAGG